MCVNSCIVTALLCFELLMSTSYASNVYIIQFVSFTCNSMNHHKCTSPVYTTFTHLIQFVRFTHNFMNHV